MSYRHARRPTSLLGALLLALCATSCGGAASPGSGVPDGGSPSPPGDGDTGGELQGGVLVTLVDRGDLFRIWVTEPQAAQTLVDVWRGDLPFTNIVGRIRSGSGDARHNEPWSWHLDPDSILVNIYTFAPVYSGTPSEVEANLAALLALDEDKLTGNDGASLGNVQDLRTQAGTSTGPTAPR